MRVAITGAAGQLGRQLVAAFEEPGNEVLALARPQFDITSATDLDRLAEWHPEVVVNSAAWTDVDGCALDPKRAMRINGEAAGAVGEAAARVGAVVVQISTNEVFDGQMDRPYNEDDDPNPINAYGASKLAGEHLVAGANAKHVIVRTAWLFARDGTNFITKILAAAERAAAADVTLRIVDDEWGNPTSVEWLATAVVRLVDRTGDRPGVYHLAGEPPTTRLGWAETALPPTVRVIGIPSAQFKRASRPPLRAVLAMGLARQMAISPGEWQSASREIASAHQGRMKAE